MRRGEVVLLILFVIGVLLHLIPGPDHHVAPSAASQAPSTPSLADPAGQASPARAGSAEEIGEFTLDSYSLDPTTATRLKLPERLKEISGLALTPDGRLLAHNDEQGIVYEIDCHSGAITKSFALSDSGHTRADDFEGIAATSDRIYLVTSVGRLYEAREGADGQPVPYVIHETGLGKDYEIEGLAYEPGTQELLLASKVARGTAWGGRLYVFRWSIQTKRLAPGEPIEIPVHRITRRIPGKTFNASGIERQPRSGHYFLVAARQNAIAEITPTGELVGVKELRGEWHRQVEGVTFGSDDSLILADEGAGKRARLTIYPVTLR